VDRRANAVADDRVPHPHVGVLRAEEFQFLVFLRFVCADGAGDPVRQRNFAGDALQAGLESGVLVVEFIMREVSGGWFIRYMHSTGASFFFIVVYLHMFRGLLYGSYRKPRELVWVVGWLIFLSLMAESFFGYLLPWGQMSFWGAQVIINLFDSIPLIGRDLSLWIRGDFVVGDATLNRFFSLHVVAVPLALLALVVAHIFALHDVGSNSPDGVEIKDHTDANGRPLDGIPFHPYYTVHDLYGLGFFFLAYCAVLFFAPEMGGVFLEGNNFSPADPFQTPQHIAPLWYSRLTTRSCAPPPRKFVIWLGLGALFLGVLAYLRVRKRWARFGVALVTFIVFIPDDGSAGAAGPEVVGRDSDGAVHDGVRFAALAGPVAVRSIRYRPGWHKVLVGVFVAAFLVLGYLGMNPPTPVSTVVAQLCAACYFGFFFLMPWWSRMGEFKPVPARVTFAAIDGDPR